MSDIVERLRADADFIDRDAYDECWEVKETARGKCLREASDAIATLRGENERMREVLQRLIDAASCIHHWHDAMQDGSGMVVSAEHVRKLWKETDTARAALKEGVQP